MFLFVLPCRYQACAINLVGVGACSALKICVKDGTVGHQDLQRFFADNFIVPRLDDQQVYDCLKNHIGNVIAGDGFVTATATVRAQGYDGPYQTSSRMFSREQLAVVTRQDDPQWSSFVNWVIMATFFAEEQNITKATYMKMPTTNLFGADLSGMFQNAILAVGSHGEILAQNAQGKYNVNAINHLNTIPYGPQHYPPSGLFGLL